MLTDPQRDGTFAGDPGGIIRAGWRIRELGGELRTTVASRQVRLSVPAGTNANWVVGTVATAVTTDWQAYLTQLAGRIGGYGENLVTAGDEYRAADDAAVRRLR